MSEDQMLTAEEIEAIEPQSDGEIEQAESSEEGAEKPVQDEFDPAQWGYKYKGQTMYPKDRQHALTLMQQAHDANVRNAEYKERMAEIEEQRKQFAQYQKLDDAFKQNPEFAQKIWSMYNNQGQPTQDDSDEPQHVKDLRNQVYEQQQMLAQLQSNYETWNDKEADKAIQDEIESLKSKYADHDWDSDDGNGSLVKRVIEHAIKLNNVPLETAYRDYMWDNVQVNAKSEALKKAKADRLAQKKAGVVLDGPHSRPKSAPPDIRNMNWQQVTEQAMKEMT